MAARLDSVCKYLCETADWKLSNLELQKILYLAQMINMGRNNGARLVEADFQAWDYGPVEPTLYHKAKIFGAAPLQDIFFEAKKFQDDDSRSKLMDEVCTKFMKYSAGELVEITHWDEGAWAKNYVPGARHTPISDEDIWAEYRKRQERGR